MERTELLQRRADMGTIKPPRVTGGKWTLAAKYRGPTRAGSC
jgi:hypothetical protein